MIDKYIKGVSLKAKTKIKNKNKAVAPQTLWLSTSPSFPCPSYAELVYIGYQPES